MLYMVYKVEFDKDKPRSSDLVPMILKITNSKEEARSIFMEQINEIETNNNDFETELIGDTFEYDDTCYIWGLLEIKELKED